MFDFSILPPSLAGVCVISWLRLAAVDSDNGGVWAAVGIAVATLVTTVLQQRRSAKNKQRLAAHDESIDRLDRELSAERTERRALAEDLSKVKRLHAECEARSERLERKVFNLLNEIHDLKERYEGGGD